jgi:hypothetical protein
MHKKYSKNIHLFSPSPFSMVPTTNKSPFYIHDLFLGLDYEDEKKHAIFVFLQDLNSPERPHSLGSYTASHVHFTFSLHSAYTGGGTLAMVWQLIPGFLFF